MAKFIKLALRKKLLVFRKTLLAFPFLFIIPTFSFSDDVLDESRSLFLKGDYESAIKEASNYDSAEAKILMSRILSIYTNFYLKDKSAEENFLKAYEIAKEAIQMSPKNDEAYVEAAHALGRYGQKIGIMSAITKGIADRVKKYLDKALEINSNNILANLSKGIWHAEIINQAGKTVAKAVYGAKIDKATKHFEIVKNHKNFNEIGILYELAYGYSLLEDDIYLAEARLLIESLLNKTALSDMDKIYVKKGSILLKVLP